MLLHPERWKSLRPRYEQDRPHRMLALDGGGIRGILTLGILQKIEKLIADKSGQKMCDYFDYIAGTSTGAIIAACLARGMSTAEIFTFYNSAGKQMFESAHLMQRLQCLYTADPLKAKLQDVFGHDTTLEPPEVPTEKSLQCLLLVVTKNFTTDSPWPVSTNPDAKYNDPTRKDCNLKVPLWQLVRASTAAPVFFPPEVLAWDPIGPEKELRVRRWRCNLPQRSCIFALPHGHRASVSIELGNRRKELADRFSGHWSWRVDGHNCRRRPTRTWCRTQSESPAD